MDLLTPRRSPSSTLPLHTQKQCTARGSSWGSSIHVSWPLKAPGSSLWEGRQTSCQPADASTPDNWFHGVSNSLTATLGHTITLPVPLRGGSWVGLSAQWTRVFNIYLSQQQIDLPESWRRWWCYARSAPKTTAGRPCYCDPSTESRCLATISFQTTDRTG